jgi:hypothetical protein
MDNFQPTGANEPIFLPYRKAGDQFWPSLKKADEIKTATDAIKAQIKKIDEQLAALLTEEQHLEEPKAEGAPPLSQRTQEQISDQRNQLTGQKSELESKL